MLLRHKVVIVSGVSPMNTGLGNSTFSKPRLPTVVPSVRSTTERPTRVDSVNRLFTSR